MFSAGETVICVDDTFPNPNCTFPNGVVVRGQRYNVWGVTLKGGVRITGLPVLPAFVTNPIFAPYIDAGWKPHRFRRIADDPLMDSVERSQDLELVGANRQ
jgi:hypothetical protein